MNRLLVKIDITVLFLCLFSVRALIKGSPVDAVLVLIMMASMTLKAWLAARKLQDKEALDKRLTAIEAQLSTLQAAVTLKRSY